MDLTLFLEENQSSFSERSQIQETKYCVISLHAIPRKGKIVEAESRLMVACGGHGEVEIKSNVHRASSWSNERVLKLIYGDGCTT